MTPEQLSRGLASLSGDGWIGRWSPGIGDPSAMGWLTVLLYALGAWQCLRVAKANSALALRRERLLWGLLAFGLLALGINKQLDLQSALTEIGRIVAAQEGWYARRHEIQTRFIYGVIALAAGTTVALLFLARRTPPATLLALAGSVSLLAFVVIRAASFHRFDRLIGSEYLGLRMNWIMEIGGIAIVIAGARWRMRPHP